MWVHHNTLLVYCISTRKWVKIASASAGKASEHSVLMTYYLAKLPSWGLLALWWWFYTGRSGGDFTLCGAQRVWMAENFNAMTSFFETYCSIYIHKGGKEGTNNVIIVVKGYLISLQGLRVRGHIFHNTHSYQIITHIHKSSWKKCVLFNAQLCNMYMYAHVCAALIDWWTVQIANSVRRNTSVELSFPNLSIPLWQMSNKIWPYGWCHSQNSHFSWVLNEMLIQFVARSTPNHTSM